MGWTPIRTCLGELGGVAGWSGSDLCGEAVAASQVAVVTSGPFMVGVACLCPDRAGCWGEGRSGVPRAHWLCQECGCLGALPGESPELGVPLVAWSALGLSFPVCDQHLDVPTLGSRWAFFAPSVAPPGVPSSHDGVDHRDRPNSEFALFPSVWGPGGPPLGSPGGGGLEGLPVDTGAAEPAPTELLCFFFGSPASEARWAGQPRLCPGWGLVWPRGGAGASLFPCGAQACCAEEVT